MAEADSQTNLIINYLPQTLTDAEFHALFAAIGPLRSSKIIRDHMTNYSYGFGFVDYTTVEDAEKAIQTLNGLRLQNKMIKVAYSRNGENIKGANLYVKNIPKEMTEDELQQYFVEFGTIVQCRILTDSVSGKSKGVGFILYESRDQAMQAVGALDGTIPNGFTEPLSVKFADENRQKSKQKVVVVRTPVAVPQSRAITPLFGTQLTGRRGIGPGPIRGQGRSNNRFNPIQAARYRTPTPVVPSLTDAVSEGDESGHILFVYNIGSDTNEQTLWRIFAEYGEVRRVNVIRDFNKKQGKGYGFVTMANYYEACQAIEALNGYNMFGKPLQVSFKSDKQ